MLPSTRAAPGNVCSAHRGLGVTERVLGDRLALMSWNQAITAGVLLRVYRTAVKGYRPCRGGAPAARVARLVGLAMAVAALFTTGATASASPLSPSRPVDWSQLKYPVDCDRTPTGVLEAVRVPGTGRDDVTVVLLQCMWEDGTGWASVLSSARTVPRRGCSK